MTGQGVSKAGLEELLFRMTSEQKLAFNGQLYSAK